jgi:hypothetical protein
LPLTTCYLLHSETSKQKEGQQQADKEKIRPVIDFCPSFYCSPLAAHCQLSSDHPIRSRQDIRRNGQADLLGALEIDDSRTGG